ncbi:anti-sigma factor domain-containing protein [Bacillus halotolerans]|uniref:Anti-sigma factor domain-containing protein n=1 Tax=Bacillus halotolerans TaxID=260554 RepID=A0ABY7I580_9BACI|nr:anti-sigma factor domain-containing protein [Bacillus halotolerans]MBV5120769.1 anti-sigma factor domain-containing protein [Bacillus halotolerans]MCC2114569.1 anti-sigma factor domain-containing protein [Bacillus halotolerans]MDG0765828.1 anti-sigma factor domain-containing protein [Bacillus halotolerans]UUI85735.1 anti-sigma factor domain-containing protein [Bacillus halotolerans]WAT22739.1 anti-sigma factor domain-containing protein [Bacillus halotolerans]
MRRGIIVEKNKKFVTLLTPDGQFLKAKNDRQTYEIGEEIMLPSETRMGRRASFFDVLRLRPFKMGIFSMTAIMLFIFIILPVFSNNKAYAYMTIDINPSFEMALNSDYEVIELTPLNDDGKKVISDIDDWEETDFKKVIDDIITDCSEQGYVKESKEILISTVYENTDDDTYKSGVKKQLNDVTEKYKTTYRMESLETDMKTREKAKKEGVSTGSYIKSNEKNNMKDPNEGSQKSGEEDQKNTGSEEENTDQTDDQDSKQGENEQLDDTDSQKEDTTDTQNDDSEQNKDVKESDENTKVEKDGDTEQTPTQVPQDNGNEEDNGEQNSKNRKNWNNGEKGKDHSSSNRDNASYHRNPNGYSSNNESAQTEDSPSAPGE